MAKVEDLLLREIWIEILTRVPVKSILRCRSVCKSWYSLISCPNFISNYSTQNVNNRVLLQQRNTTTSFSSLDKSFMDSTEHDEVPEPFLGEHLVIVGSCNGLICLCKFESWSSGYAENVFRITFLIWNPTIRKIGVLPSRSYCSSTQYPTLFGFGFDSNTSDYKVFCAVGKSMCDDFSDMIANGCEIFDLRKGAWRVISPQVDSSWNVFVSPHPECYVNGAVHWSGSYGHRQAKSYDRIILSFDMTDEVYREIRMPNCAELALYGDDRDLHIHTRSVTFDGLINVIVCHVDSDYFVDASKSCSVWAMKEYGVTESWTKVLNIDLLSAQVLPTTGLWPSFFRLWGNGEVLMVHYLLVDEDVDGKEELIMFNTESREPKYLFSVPKGVEDLCLYEESLVLM